MKRLDEDGCRKIKKASLGRRCWFRVDSKSFEISLESVNGKVVGKIVERGWGLSSWIRFAEKILAKLLEGAKECFVGKVKEPFRRVWNEGGRGYKLELCSNKARRFLLCSAMCAKEKRFSCFPRGKCFLRGMEDSCL